MGSCDDEVISEDESKAEIRPERFASDWSTAALPSANGALAALGANELNGNRIA